MAREHGAGHGRPGSAAVAVAGAKGWASGGALGGAGGALGVAVWDGGAAGAAATARRATRHARAPARAAHRRAAAAAAANSPPAAFASPARALVIAGPGRPVLPCPAVARGAGGARASASALPCPAGRHAAASRAASRAASAPRSHSAAGYARPSRLTAPAHAGTVTTQTPPARPAPAPPAAPAPAQPVRPSTTASPRTSGDDSSVSASAPAPAASSASASSAHLAACALRHPHPARLTRGRVLSLPKGQTTASPLISAPARALQPQAPRALTALDGRLPCPLHWAWRRREAAAQDRWRRAGDGQTRDAPQQRARPWPRVARLPTRGETCIRWKELLCLPANWSSLTHSLSLSLSLSTALLCQLRARCSVLRRAVLLLLRASIKPARSYQASDGRLAMLKLRSLPCAPQDAYRRVQMLCPPIAAPSDFPEGRRADLTPAQSPLPSHASFSRCRAPASWQALQTREFLGCRCCARVSRAPAWAKASTSLSSPLAHTSRAAVTSSSTLPALAADHHPGPFRAFRSPPALDPLGSLPLHGKLPDTRFGRLHIDIPADPTAGATTKLCSRLLTAGMRASRLPPGAPHPSRQQLRACSVEPPLWTWLSVRAGRWSCCPPSEVMQGCLSNGQVPSADESAARLQARSSMLGDRLLLALSRTKSAVAEDRAAGICARPP
ncbi:hypothetical protein B0J12DRAFT_698747 [Macrophomina phaseolina]|uniref:Uncharacterized protein n=1 Tax=Macrophomina phaseolina TaxID=35725 RepID=A0ABQ8GCI2_9PEZI|nr:hypothetical protein B0J12DRAFT_698747 [Macrophomina phaseolina]